MKISKDLFLSHVAPLVKIAGRRTTMPITNHLLIGAEHGILTVRATDNELDATERIPCEGDLSACCVPAERLFNFCRTAKEFIEMDVVEQALRVKASGVANIGIMDAKEFPANRKSETVAMGVNSADVARALKQVEFACARDTVDRPFKNCVNLVSKDNQLHSYGYNVKIVAFYIIPSIAAEFSFFLNHQYVPMVCDALVRDGSQLHLSSGCILVTHDAGSVSAPLTNCEGPEWQCGMVLPDGAPDGAVGVRVKSAGKIPREALLQSAKICKTFAASDSDKIRLSFGERLRLKTMAPCAPYKCDIESENRTFEVSMSSGYLAECLSAFEGAALEIAENAEAGKIALKGGDLTVLVSTMKE